MITPVPPTHRNPPLPPDTAKLFTSLVSDALDAAGCPGQAFSPATRPLDDTKLMIGRARTGSYVEVAHVEPGANPYELEIALVDDLQPGDIVVLACGGSNRIAPWGGLLSTAATVRGAAGCVTDGFVRDVIQIRDLGFPVFHRGIAPLDSKGRGELRAIDVPVICDGVRVAPGDMIVGDADGLVVVPAAIEADVMAHALKKLEGESNTLRELQAGGYLRDAYAKYGVL